MNVEDQGAWEREQDAAWRQADRERGDRVADYTPAAPRWFHCAMPSAIPPRPRCAVQCEHCRMIEFGGS